MLNLIISRTGYGKTTYIKEKIKELVDNKKEVILIIPEQISFETERDILRTVGAYNLKNVSVMSFTRMCSMFFAIYGGREKPYIDTVGKIALMEETLKKLSPTLDLFKKSALTPQFCEMMLTLSANTKKNDVTSEKLYDCALQNNGILKQKLIETSMILSDYENALSKDYFDPLDDLSVVTDRLEKEPFFEGKTVFIDSFTGFTSQQIKVIEKILKTAENTYISLGFDGVYSSNALSTFANMAKNALKFKQIATENGISVAQDIVLSENHRFQNAELDFMEKGIFSDEKLEYPDKCENICITKCKNIYEEAEFVAKKILHLTGKKNIRYREISVISRDSDAYNEILKETFEKYSIPMFVDSREGVENLSLFKLVSFALCAVSKNLESESVISLVKTGLTGVDDETASLFELYTYVWRVNKKDFTKPFDMPVNSFVSGDEKYLCDVAKQIEQAREKIINPLVKFNKEKGTSVKSYIRAIYNLINDYSCTTSLKSQADDFARNGYIRLSDNTVRSFDIMIHILDQLYLSLGEQEMSLKRFCDVFESAVTLLDVGTLPQGLDAVAVGSAERMRPKAPRVTFVIGANEGVFPSSSAGKGLFTDSELMNLKDKGINLPFYDVETAVDEQYLAYCALCSPSEKLYVSYLQQGIDGEEKEPSVIIENLIELFPSLSIKVFDNKEIYSEYDALRIYALSKGEDKEIKKYFELNSNNHFENLNLAKLDKLANIEPNTAGELYGKNIYTSASKIEVYNKCRFKYFCQYGIKADAIKEIKIDNLIRGSIVHEVLEKIINEYSAKEFFELSFEEAFAKVEEIASAYQTKNSPIINKTPVEKYRFKKLCNMIMKLATKVFYELEQSEFDVAKTELAIGGKSPDIPAYEVNFSKGKIVLTGYVDRVDTANKNNKKFVRIIDYKTGDKTLNLADLIYGQNLQMPLYMKAVVENGKSLFGECNPAGMFYFKAENSVLNEERSASDEHIKQQITKSSKLNGVFLDDEDAYTAIEPGGQGVYSPVKITKTAKLHASSQSYSYEQFSVMSEYIDYKLKETAEKISNGEIAPNPLDSDKSACEYCDYSEVCKFYGKHEKIESMKDEDVYQFMNSILKGEGE